MARRLQRSGAICLRYSLSLRCEEFSCQTVEASKSILGICNCAFYEPVVTKNVAGALNCIQTLGSGSAKMQDAMLDPFFGFFFSHQQHCYLISVCPYNIQMRCRSGCFQGLGTRPSKKRSETYPGVAHSPEKGRRLFRRSWQLLVCKDTGPCNFAAEQHCP